MPSQKTTSAITGTKLKNKKLWNSAVIIIFLLCSIFLCGAYGTYTGLAVIGIVFSLLITFVGNKYKKNDKIINSAINSEYRGGQGQDSSSQNPSIKDIGSGDSSNQEDITQESSEPQNQRGQNPNTQISQEQKKESDGFFEKMCGFFSNSDIQLLFWCSVSIFFSLTFIFKVDYMHTFVNFLALSYSLSFALIHKDNHRKYTILGIILAPLLAFLQLINVTRLSDLFEEGGDMINQRESTDSTESEISKDSSKQKTNGLSGRDYVNFGLQITLGVIVSLLVLAIVVPLLSSSNPIFRSWTEYVYDSIFKGLITIADNFFKNIISFILGVPFRVVIFCGAFFFGVPRLISSLVNPKEKPKNRKVSDSIDFAKNNWVVFLIPKISTLIVLIIFLISQSILYSKGTEGIYSSGNNFGALNDSFAQLSIVCVIVFLVNYFDTSKKNYNKMATWFLLIASIVLVLVGPKGNLDYITDFGITLKRLYGIAALALIFGLIRANIFYVYDNLEKTAFWKMFTSYGFLVLIVVNVLNFNFINHSSFLNGGREEKYNYLPDTDISMDSYLFDRVIQKQIEIRQKHIELASSGNGSGVDIVMTKDYPEACLYGLEFSQDKYAINTIFGSRGATVYVGDMNLRKSCYQKIP